MHVSRIVHAACPPNCGTIKNMDTEKNTRKQLPQRGQWDKVLLGVGFIAGIGLGWSLLRRWRARQSSPLLQENQPGTALVTGASSGIGAAYAQHLAAQGYDVVLVARREARLRALAETLVQQYHIAAEVVVADLSTSEGIAKVETYIPTFPNLTMLVNNAGFGVPGKFATNDITQQEAMIQLHVLATVRLTRAALGVMLAQHRGAIVNVSSVAAFYPMPGNATYSATKSYLNMFTETLHQELVETGVRVQVLCPGFTRTEFQESAHVPSEGLPDFLWLSPEQVVDKSWRDLQNGQVLSVPGLGYQGMVLLARLMPRSVLYIFGRLIKAVRGGSKGGFGGFHRRTYTRLSEFWDDVRFMRQHRAQIRIATQLVPLELRERLMLTVTQVNGCRYCAQYHSKLALEGGLTQDEVTELLAGIVDHCPPEEAIAVFYAQHWAEQEGKPDAGAQLKLIETYGEEKAAAIEVLLRMIKVGNYAGNTWDYVLYRMSGGRWGN